MTGIVFLDFSEKFNVFRSFKCITGCTDSYACISIKSSEIYNCNSLTVAGLLKKNVCKLVILNMFLITKLLILIPWQKFAYDDSLIKTVRLDWFKFLIYFTWPLRKPATYAFVSNQGTSAVTDKRFVDKTSILRKYDMSKKILFCRHNNVLFWKGKDSFKKQNIDKRSLQKGLTVCEKRCKQVQRHAWCSASPDDPSRNSKFGFWLEHHRIYFLTIILSTIVAVGMKFDPTCRQRNLSSTTALQGTGGFEVLSKGQWPCTTTAASGFEPVTSWLRV